MELLILFLIAAVGAAWWLNAIMQKKADSDAKAKLDKQENEAPYKVEPTVTTPPVTTVAKEVEIKPVEAIQTVPEPVPVVETVVVDKVKRPRKPAVKKPAPVAAKARVKKTVAKKKISSK